MQGAARVPDGDASSKDSHALGTSAILFLCKRCGWDARKLFRYILSVHSPAVTSHAFVLPGRERCPIAAA